MEKITRIVVLIVVCCYVLLMPGTSNSVWAEALPEAYIMDNYWFYEGYLAENLRDAGFIVIPEQPILLYEKYDITSNVAGTLQPSQESRLLGITYIAHPEKEKFEVKKTLTATDGKTVLQPADTIGFLSRVNDCLAVYYKGTLAFVSIEALGGSEIVTKLNKFGRDAERQWLYLDNGQGLAGWCQFSKVTGVTGNIGGVFSPTQWAEVPILMGYCLAIGFRPSQNCLSTSASGENKSEHSCLASAEECL